MHSILRLQEEYLRTEDSSVLSQFYVEVLRYAKYICKVEGKGDRAEDAYDLASMLVERLMTKKQPVIKSTPAGYLNASLRFMGKPRKEVLIFDWMDGKLSMCDSYDADYQCLVDECMNDLVIPKRLSDVIEHCLRTGESAAIARESVPEEDRKIFDMVMTEVRKYAERRICGKS